jgi:hypothetical protein
VAALRQNNTSALEFHRQHRALVVRTANLATDPLSADRLLLFCRQRGISVLFVNARDLVTVTDSPGDQDFFWRRLLGEAHRRGITLYALAGDDGWLTSPEPGYAQIDALARFQTIGLPGEQFDGLLVDLPALSSAAGATALLPPVNASDPSKPATPPTLDAHTGNATPAASVDQLATMANALELLGDLRRWYQMRYSEPQRHSHLHLGVAIPAWLTSTAVWHGVTQAEALHFADATDFLVLHNLPKSTTEIGRAADTLLAALGRLGKPAYLRLEFGRVDTPGAQLVSLQGRDEFFLEMLLGTLLRRHGNEPGFGGVAFDDWANYDLLPERLKAGAGPPRPGAPPAFGAEPPPGGGEEVKPTGEPPHEQPGGEPPR